MTRYQFRSWSARILFAIMAFSILAFGAVETWAITVIEVSILSMAIAWMIRRLVAPYRLIWNPLVVPLALVPAIAGIQYAQNWTATPYQTAGEALKWLSFALFFFLCANVFRDSEIRRKFSIALVWFGFLLAVLALVQFYTSPNLIYWTRPAPGAQVFGPFVDKNHFAVLMELLLPTALLLALRESDKQLIYFVLCGLMLASVVVCGSRAGAVVVATEVLAVLSVSALLGKGRGTHGSRGRLLASVGALTVVAVCLTLAAGTEKLAQRFKTLEKGINRAEVAAATWEIFETRPLRGYGLGSFQFVFPAFAPFDDGHRWDHAHNDPLQFAMELGIAGPIAILALIVLLFMGRYPQETWLGRILPLAGAGMHSLVEFPFQPGFPFWPSWSVYDSRLPAAMQRFSHCCQVRYSFRCRSGLRMLADHGVPAKPEGPLATPLPRRPSVTRVRWLFRAVDVTLRAQVAPKFAAACRRTTSGSDAPPQAATNNIARASRAVRPSSSADAASSSATSF